MARIKLSSKIAIPASVQDVQKAYEKSRKGLWGKAYFGQLEKRTKSMKSDFKIHKAIGVLFTFLGVRVVSDYLQSRRALRSKLAIIGHTLSAEMARNPVMRKSIADLVKQYPYLFVNKKGEIFLSSFSGSVIDPSTVFGKIFNPDNLKPQVLETYRQSQAFGQKLDLKLLLSMGSPKFDAAKLSSRKPGTSVPSAKDVTAAALGNNELRIFTRSVSGTKTISTERIITSEQVRSKKLVDSRVAGKKVLLLRVKIVGKPVELIRLELDAKKAEALFKAFNVRG